MKLMYMLFFGEVKSKLSPYLLGGCIGLFFILFSCSQPNKTPTSDNSVHQKIDSLEMVLYQDAKGAINQKAAQDLMLTYEKYVDQHPDDTISAEYLFRNAQVALGLKLGSRSAMYLEQFYNHYPQHPKAPQALFMQAFVYETELNNMERAKIKYQEFITKYPNHEFYLDAELSLENLGKSEEDLMKEFEKKNAIK